MASLSGSIKLAAPKAGDSLTLTMPNGATVSTKAITGPVSVTLKASDGTRVAVNVTDSAVTVQLLPDIQPVGLFPSPGTFPSSATWPSKAA